VRAVQRELSEILAIRESSGSHFGLMLVAVESDVPALKDSLQIIPATGTVVALDGRAFWRARLRGSPTHDFLLDAKMIIRHINAATRRVS